MLEKGNKRRAIANRLESLGVPSNVESTDIASLREWLPADGIYLLSWILCHTKIWKLFFHKHYEYK